MTNKLPDVLLSNDEFKQVVAQAEALGRSYADGQIKELQFKLNALLSPPKSMVEFEKDVVEFKGTLSALDLRVQKLDSALTSVLAKTEAIIEAVNKNACMLVIMTDSAKLGLRSLDHADNAAADKKDHHIQLARQYLSKALRSYNRLRN